MIPVIEAPFRTALMAGLGGLHRAAAGQGPAVRRAVGVATVARRTDRQEAVTPAAGLLAEGLVHGVGARGATSDWTASPNRDTTGATGSVCRSSRRSRGSGGTRALTLVFPPVRYPTDRVDTTTGAMDAAALLDAHDASTRCLQNRPEGGFAQRPQPVIFLLIKNPEEPRDRTDATTRVQICALSRERRHCAWRYQDECGHPVRIGREGVGEDLQGDLAVELRVGSLSDLSHPAFPEQHGDVVVPEAGAWTQGHDLLVNGRVILRRSCPPAHGSSLPPAAPHRRARRRTRAREEIYA